MLTQWLESQDCKLLNTFNEFIYTHYSENSFSIIDLTFITLTMLIFVKNWQIDEEMTIDSDYEVNNFIISIKEAKIIKSSLNSLYNVIKADWTKFAKEL